MRRGREEPTICVGATVSPDLPFGRETLHALPDPASSHQAVLQNVPFFIHGLNFGDVIRIGPPDWTGVHPIEAVVEASGHRRFLLLLENHPTDGLVSELAGAFPEHLLRMEDGGHGLLAVSMHPDLEADLVADFVVDWMYDNLPRDEDLWDETAFSISEAVMTTIGPLAPGFSPPH